MFINKTVVTLITCPSWKDACTSTCKCLT